jgi:hypothetical protein
MKLILCIALLQLKMKDQAGNLCKVMQWQTLQKNSVDA